MELTDAINHLKESLADPTHKWGCEECKEEHEQLLKWLIDYVELKHTHAELMLDYIHLNEKLRTVISENNKLSAMLETAVTDFETVMRREKCTVCVNNYDCCCDYDDRCEWQHHSEAMKLLGGADNAEN